MPDPVMFFLTMSSLDKAKPNPYALVKTGISQFPSRERCPFTLPLEPRLDCVASIAQISSSLWASTGFSTHKTRMS